MKNCLGLAAIVLAVIVVGYAVGWVAKDYNDRMVEMNHHYCVEVYGLDEACQ
mgnify:CR=1 FL=1